MSISDTVWKEFSYFAVSSGQVGSRFSWEITGIFVVVYQQTEKWYYFCHRQSAHDRKLIFCFLSTKINTEAAGSLRRHWSVKPAARAVSLLFSIIASYLSYCVAFILCLPVCVRLTFKSYSQTLSDKIDLIHTTYDLESWILQGTLVIIYLVLQDII